MSSFFRGLASVFALQPPTRRRPEFTFRGQNILRRTTLQAMQQDWAVLGGALSSAMNAQGVADVRENRKQ